MALLVAFFWLIGFLGQKLVSFLRRETYITVNRERFKKNHSTFYFPTVMLAHGPACSIPPQKNTYFKISPEKARHMRFFGGQLDWFRQQWPKNRHQGWMEHVLRCDFYGPFGCFERKGVFAMILPTGPLGFRFFPVKTSLRFHLTPTVRVRSRNSHQQKWLWFWSPKWVSSGEGPCGWDLRSVEEPIPFSLRTTQSWLCFFRWFLKDWDRMGW